MIRKVITTLYEGLAPIHEKYIKQAKDSKQDLQIVYGKDEMTIPYRQLKERIVKWTGGNRDKFDGTHYSIAYFNWTPATEEDKLKEFSKQCL